MALKTQIILPLQGRHDGVPADLLRKFVAGILLDHTVTELICQIPVRAAYRQTGRFRPRSRQILVGIFLQIDQAEPGKQRIDTAYDISHLPVFLLQPFFLLSEPDDQDNDIGGKKTDQHKFQLYPSHIFVLNHPLCDGFRECLHKNKIIIFQIGHADIVGFAVRFTDKGTFPAVFKNVPHLHRRIFIDHVRSSQHVDEVPAKYLSRRACDDTAVRYAQIHACRLPEISNSKHILQIPLRHIGSPQDTDDLSFIIYRGIETDHGFIKKMGIKQDNTVALAFHTAQKEGTPAYITGSPVRGMIDPLCIRKHHRIKQRIILYFL